MKPTFKITSIAGLLLFASLTLSLFVVAAASAQNAGSPPQFYGQWQPPTQTDTATANANESSSPSLGPQKFRQLFPPTRNATGNNSGMLTPQRAAPATQPPRARPLNPIRTQPFPSGTFADLKTSGSPIAAVANVEAAPPESAFSEIENDVTANNFSQSGLQPPPRDTNTLSTAWPPQSTTETAAESKSQLSGLWSWIQTSGQNSFDGFQKKGGWGEQISSVMGSSGDKTRRVFGSLAVVLGGYFAFVWLMRRFSSGSHRGIPTEVIEVIGHAPFGPRKNLQLVRLGSKLLLLMNGPEGTHPVGEVTDPEEVDYLISLCKGKRTKATGSVMSAIKRMRDGSQVGDGNSNKRSTRAARTVEPVQQPAANREATVSASQLVQALQTLQGNAGSANTSTVFEA